MMTRRNEHGSSKRAKEPVWKLLEIIVDDVVVTRSMPTDEWRKLSPDPFTSMAIPAGQDRMHPCTQIGIDAAHTLVEQSWSEREDLRQTVAREKFKRLAFEAIGLTITACPSHLPPGRGEGVVDDAFYEAMAKDYAANLELNATQARTDLDRHIPCHLFDTDQNLRSFEVGPVHFLTRQDWIAKFVTKPAVLTKIREAEAARPTRTALADRLLAAGADRDAHDAWVVLSVIAGYSWIATVRLSKHEPMHSHDKAMTIVELAMNTIGLRFHLEDARHFSKAGRQHLFSEDRLATTTDGIMLRGASTSRPGIGGPPGSMIAKMLAERPFLDAAGRLLDLYVKARNTGRAPHVIERWANALYWLGEARRETSDFMAVVDYGCAADGLSGAGGEARSMAVFAEAALNPRGDASPPGKLSVRDAVLRVYQEGRNKLAHGEEPGLFEDLSEVRATGDQLVVAMMNVVTLVLDETVNEKPEILSIPKDHAYRLLKMRLKNQV